ncbi:CCC motif membrane protein [Xanthomarina sp. F1114]|uniref:CCC motif membrane protein n=1 Tax=Xanthomarina sp. F1114 TaxID=2996019 RepID=UPI00225E3046|nr:CCC motif membrane protein [Xanthomarina sp. F1114]MCX7547666.1 CCC motif membrane protein [Xanthomarina sp. F1114]
MEKQPLQNSTLILVLGILSIVTCCCYGVLGLPIGIVALILANKSTKIYTENPELYTGYNNLKTGKILAIIGIVLNVIFLAYVIWILNIVGWEALQDPEMLQEKLQEFQQMQSL